MKTFWSVFVQIKFPKTSAAGGSDVLGHHLDMLCVSKTCLSVTTTIITLIITNDCHWSLNVSLKHFKQPKILFVLIVFFSISIHVIVL